MGIEFSPAQDGSGVIVADDGSRKPFPAGTNMRDLFAMLAQFLQAHSHAAPPVTVVIDLNTVTNLQGLVDAAQAAISGLRDDVNAGQAAIQTISGRITTIQADIAAIKARIGL